MMNQEKISILYSSKYGIYLLLDCILIQDVTTASELFEAVLCSY
jgi:hypothetical protein